MTAVLQEYIGNENALALLQQIDLCDLLLAFRYMFRKSSTRASPSICRLTMVASSLDLHITCLWTIANLACSKKAHAQLLRFGSGAQSLIVPVRGTSFLRLTI